MSEEMKKDVEVKENGATNETPATPQENKPEEKKKDVEKFEFELPGWAAKTLRITKKVLKYAVPVGIAAGSVFLGVKIGKSDEKKQSSLAAADYESKLSDLQARLEEAERPALPDLSETMSSLADLPSMEVSEF